MRGARSFIFSAGVLLVIAAVAKLVSASGNARLLHYPDPILAVTFQHLFWIIGALELAVAVVCLFGRRVGLQAGLIAWLATGFGTYRLGLLWVGYHSPCPRLGTLTDALRIPPQMADTALKIVLAYMLIGSYATLFRLWGQKHKARPA